MPMISPQPEDFGKHAQLLLGLADDVDHVQTTSDGWFGMGFVVPDYLYELFMQALRIQAGEDPTEETPAETVEAAPVKRGPGRPKKIINEEPGDAV